MSWTATKMLYAAGDFIANRIGTFTTATDQEMHSTGGDGPGTSKHTVHYWTILVQKAGLRRGSVRVEAFLVAGTGIPGVPSFLISWRWLLHCRLRTELYHHRVYQEKRVWMVSNLKILLSCFQFSGNQLAICGLPIRSTSALCGNREVKTLLENQQSPPPPTAT